MIKQVLLFLYQYKKYIYFISTVFIVLIVFLFVLPNKKHIVSNSKLTTSSSNNNVVADNINTSKTETTIDVTAVKPEKQEPDTTKNTKIKSLGLDEVVKGGSRSIPVTTIYLSLTDFDIYEKTVGTLYNMNSTVISSEVSGVVDNIKVELGDFVKAGQVLAEIDKKPLLNDKKAQESSMKQFEIQLKDQRKTLNRYNELSKDGFVSQAELDAASTKYDTLKSQLDNSKSLLSNINLKIQKSTIKAKISGVVQIKNISKGDFANIGSELFTIVDNKHLTVIANFPESFLSIIRPRQSVILMPTGLKDKIPAKIKELKPLLEENSRSIQAIIDLPNVDYKLRPGGTVEVLVLIEKKQNAVVVPEESIVLRNNGYVVYKINPDKESVSETIVSLGSTQNSKVEILSGLNGDEEIVVDGSGFLSNNAKINIKTS